MIPTSVACEKKHCIPMFLYFNVSLFFRLLHFLYEFLKMELIILCFLRELLKSVPKSRQFLEDCIVFYKDFYHFNVKNCWAKLNDNYSMRSVSEPMKNMFSKIIFVNKFIERDSLIKNKDFSGIEARKWFWELQS